MSSDPPKKFCPSFAPGQNFFHKTSRRITGQFAVIRLLAILTVTPWESGGIRPPEGRRWGAVWREVALQVVG